MSREYWSKDFRLRAQAGESGRFADFLSLKREFHKGSFGDHYRADLDRVLRAALFVMENIYVLCSTEGREMPHRVKTPRSDLRDKV